MNFKYLPLSLLIAVNCFGDIYQNSELSIDFKTSINRKINSPNLKKGYFYSAKEIIYFNPPIAIKKKITDHNNKDQQRLLIEMIQPQQIQPGQNIVKTINRHPLSHSTSGSDLHSLFILPKKPINDVNKEIHTYPKKYPHFQLIKGPKMVMINNIPLLKWRYQAGKTRLDHFLLFGKRQNYLFISSPYSSSKDFEKRVGSIKLKKNTPNLTKPFTLTIGRGSGRYGLNTIEINHLGRVTLYRMNTIPHKNHHIVIWEQSIEKLNPQKQQQVTTAIQKAALQKLWHLYPNTINDGTQWIIQFTQNNQTSLIYCDNLFPEKLKQLAQSIDKIIQMREIPAKNWHRVPKKDWRKHEHHLWSGINP